MSSAECDYQRLIISCQKLNSLFRTKFMFRGAVICGLCFTLAIAIVLIVLEQLWAVCSVVGLLGVIYLLVDRRVQAINSKINEMLAVVEAVNQQHIKGVNRKEG